MHAAGCREDPRIRKLICVAGVVNLAATMREIYKEDIFGKFQTGYRWGITDFLGFDINTDVFLETVIRSGLHDLPGTSEDAAKLRVPFVLLLRGAGCLGRAGRGGAGGSGEPARPVGAGVGGDA